MSGQTTAANVKVVATLKVSQSRAFEVVTREYASWVPEGQYMSPEKPAAVVLEPRAGGRWFERSKDGAEIPWGSVLAFEPSSRLLLGWHLNSQWQFVADPKQASEIEVRFIADGPNKTRVELEHRAFERHGAEAEAIRGAVGSPDGWPKTMERFASAANA
jgi:uncharacterized protein YndB with AHSA1/START domain